MIWHASIRAARRRGVVRVLCRVSTSSRQWIDSEKKCARRQLNREEYVFSLSPFAPENLV